MKNIIDKHEGYIYSCYMIAGVYGAIIGLYEWVVTVLNMIHTRNVIGIIFVFVIQTLWISLSIIMNAVIWGTVLVVVLLIPYLIVRALVK